MSAVLHPVDDDYTPDLSSFGVDSQIAQLRIPPHSIEAESSVLGGLLLDNGAWDRVGDLLVDGDFYRYEHRLVYAAIGSLINATRPADVITVYERLQSEGKADEIGGLVYLNALAQYVPSAANIRRYAEIVRERAILRKLVSASDEISTSAFNTQGKDVAKILDESEQKIFAIGEEGSRMKKGFQGMDSLVVQLLDRVQEMSENPNDITGVPTGFVDLDKMTSGMQAGDLIILAARPSMGKAQPLDAAVRTRTGWARMGDLAVGDAVASVDGLPSIVTAIFPQGEKEVFTISFSDGRSTECCAEHLWQVQYRQWDKPRVMNTAKLAEMLQRKRYAQRLWIEPHSGDFGHEQNMPMDAWVLGSLLGDGCLTGAGTVRFSTAEPQMLEMMSQRLGSDMAMRHAGRYDWRIVRELGANAKGVQGVQPNPVRLVLDALGLTGLASDKKFIPKIYLEACKSVRLDVLRGLLDTDGWVEKWGSVRFSTSSIQLARDVQALARSLGGWCSINVKQPHFTNVAGMRMAGLPAYVCNIAHPEPQSLFLLSEKQARAPAQWLRKKRLTVSSVA